MRQGGDNLSLDRDPMSFNLVIKCLAEGNCVFRSLVDGQGLIAIVEPEMKLIKKVETRLRRKPLGEPTKDLLAASRTRRSLTQAEPVKPTLSR